MLIIDRDALFYFWSKEILVKRQKVSKYYDHSFFLYKKYPIITDPDPENLLIKVSEIMSKSPHQQQTHKIKTLTQES